MDIHTHHIDIYIYMLGCGDEHFPRAASTRQPGQSYHHENHHKLSDPFNRIHPQRKAANSAKRARCRCWRWANAGPRAVQKVCTAASLWCGLSRPGNDGGSLHSPAHSDISHPCFAQMFHIDRENHEIYDAGVHIRDCARRIRFDDPDPTRYPYIQQFAPSEREIPSADSESVRHAMLQTNCRRVSRRHTRALRSGDDGQIRQRDPRRHATKAMSSARSNRFITSSSESIVTASRWCEQLSIRFHALKRPATTRCPCWPT